MWADPSIPHHAENCLGVAKTFGTPVWFYDQATIEARIQELQCFDVIRFAQKANSNLALLTLMKKHGVVLDAVSAGEIVRALQVGYQGTDSVPGIVYTADIVDEKALQLIRQHQIPVNIGSADMLDQLAQQGIQVPITIRINPGFGHGHSRKTNTGGTLSKHGIWHRQVNQVITKAQKLGLNVHGLHMHIGSGTDFAHLSQVCDAMVDAALKCEADIHTISAGGGLPISYEKPAQERMDIHHYFQLWDTARRTIEKHVNHSVQLEVEPGRYLVAESGCLIAQIRAIKKMGRNLFYLVDSGFNDLMRPSFYGSFHAISVLAADGRDLGEQRVPAIVAGPLCESGDVFTQEEGGWVKTRPLPIARVGDYLVLHDTGAYGSSMSSNYNSRCYAPEVLWSGQHNYLIRERQTFEQLLANDRIPEDWLNNK